MNFHDPFVIFMGILAAFCWTVEGLAIWGMCHGDPTAINGVIGAGFGALVFTFMFVTFGRDAGA